MKLSIDQVNEIRTYVDSSGILILSLKEDVLDHLCCAVEIKVGRGKTFDQSLREAMEELAPEGLLQLENETVFLLNSNKIIRMKKLMYTLGLLSAMSIVSGSAFGVLHLPGATELFTYGFLGFAFGYLPLYAIDYFKASIQRGLTEKLRISLGLASAALMAASVVFKMMHLPVLPTFFLISGTAVFVFGFLPFLFFGMYKKSIS